MECNGCTICCKVLDVPWMNSPKGFYCKECDPGIGCKIWENVPEDCKSFACAYQQIDNINIEYRPDKCGIVFEKATDTIFLGTIDQVLNEFNDTVHKMIQIFLDKGFSVILKHTFLRHPILFNTEDRTPDSVWDEYKGAVKERHDSTSI
jgi:hypothetical protein